MSNILNHIQSLKEVIDDVSNQNKDRMKYVIKMHVLIQLYKLIKKSINMSTLDVNVRDVEQEVKSLTSDGTISMDEANSLNLVLHESQYFQVDNNKVTPTTFQKLTRFKNNVKNVDTSTKVSVANIISILSENIFQLKAHNKTGSKRKRKSNFNKNAIIKLNPEEENDSEVQNTFLKKFTAICNSEFKLKLSPEKMNELLSISITAI
jgi:hypothetical protein